MSDRNLEQERKLSVTESAESGLDRGAECRTESDSITLVPSEDAGDQSGPAGLSSDPDTSTSPGLSDLASQAKLLQIGNFRVGPELGCGAMGTVFRSSNISTGAEFAIKVFSREYCRSKEEGAHLLEALKTASAEQNPNLPAYYDCGAEDGSIYLITDYLKGVSLKELIRTGEKLSPERFIDIFKQACQALKCLHQHNLLHGDLKPSNLFLLEAEGTSNFVKLSDFGITGQLLPSQKDEFVRRSSSAGNCINYLSPEQCLGYTPDARSDIYSLGLVMYETLSGNPLISGQSQLHSLMKQLNIKPRSIAEIRKDIPESLGKIIMKCLEKNRANRYSSVDDLELDLDLASADLAALGAFSGLEEAGSLRRKTKGKSSREQRLKVALSVVIGAGVLACIIVAMVNAIPHGFHNLRAHSTSWFWRHLPGDSEGLRNLAEAQISAALASGAGQPGVESRGWRGRRFVPPGLRPNTLPAAAYIYGLAIEAHAREHRGALDRQYQEAHAAMQTRLGELLSRATFADRGGRLDRRTYYTDYSAGQNPPKLHPRFPGLRPSRTLIPDYDNAKVSFDQAKKTLEDKFDLRSAPLLWDSCFVEFNLGNYQEAIAMQQKLIDIYNEQAVQDKEALILSYDNLARIYLWTGNAEKALVELNKALRIDRDTYKLGNGLHSEQIAADLAFGLLSAGKYDAAALLARQNVKRIASQSAPDLSMSVFNTGVLAQALRQLGKAAEADKLELKLHESGQIMQPMP